jgi:hypothetical protein
MATKTLKNRNNSVRLFFLPGLSIGVDGVRDAHFVVARNDAIYFYSTDGRGQCYAIEGTLYFVEYEFNH